MSMEVSSNYKDYSLERLQEESKERVEKAGKEQVTENKQNTGNKSEGILVPKDEYIRSGQSGSRPSGLYRMGRDENGNPKVLYDDPRKNSTPKVTCNTDAVDREIEKLKKEKQQLEQQIRMASGDEEKVRELEKKLVQAENELSQKDNDTYRRQQAVITGRS